MNSVCRKGVREGCSGVVKMKNRELVEQENAKWIIQDNWVMMVVNVPWMNTAGSGSHTR